MQHDVYAPQVFDVVVVAASLGGLDALTRLLSALPGEFAVPIVVVQHLASDYRSYLADILNTRTPLRVQWAAHRERIAPGNAYIAPPDHHVTITEQHSLALSQQPKVQFARPSADVLFRSAAAAGKNRAIGVVLTGKGRDGAAGAQAIKQAGGRVIVEDWRTSKATGMPSATLATHAVDFVLPLDRIAAALVSLVMVPGGANLFFVPPSYTAHFPK